MLAVMGPTLGFDTKQRNSFLIKFTVCNKNKILTILFIVNYEKVTHFNDEFSVVVAHNQQVFACSNEEKRVRALVLSLCSTTLLFCLCWKELELYSQHFIYEYYRRQYFTKNLKHKN